MNDLLLLIPSRMARFIINRLHDMSDALEAAACSHRRAAEAFGNAWDHAGDGAAQPQLHN